MHDRRRLLIGGAIIGGAFIVIAALVIWIASPLSPLRASPAAPPPPSCAPPATPPTRAVHPAGKGIQNLVDPTWVATTAAETGIPSRVLAAYAGAAIAKAEQMPACGLSWNTLAGIGHAESDHGRHGGSSVAPDGNTTPPIFGVALDGNGVALVPDSDGGTIDGDADADRAVGPMQLIPQTWRNWHVDGGADGKEDPQNIDDAVLASANYLCRASTALNTEAGWRAAIQSYNSSPVYLGRVSTAAVAYWDATAG